MKQRRLSSTRSTLSPRTLTSCGRCKRSEPKNRKTLKSRGPSSSAAKKNLSKTFLEMLRLTDSVKLSSLSGKRPRYRRSNLAI